ncbi:MAG: WG repeat-containing protein [Patescibacteria group bacterium]
MSREGKFVMEPKYDMIRELSTERMIVSENSEYFVMKRTKDFGFEKAGGPYDLITDPHQGRAIAIKKMPDGSEVRTLVLDGIVDEKALVDGKRGPNQLKQLKIHGDGAKRNYAYVDDFAEDGIAAAQLPELSASGKPQWHILDRSGKAVNVKGQSRGALQVAADNPAEALNRYRELKFEYSNIRDASKIEKARATILKKHPTLAASGIHIIETDVEGVFRIQKETPNGFLKGYVNVKHDVVVEPKFQDIFYSDAKHGYVRVKQDGKWGVIDSKSKTGEFLIDPSKNDYVSIQVNSERHNLFEVQVRDAHGHPDATSFQDNKVGLVSLNGKVLIEPKYAYIENPREGLYRGIDFSAKDSSLSAQASYFDISSAAEGTGIGSGAKGAGQDALSRTADVAIRGNDYRAKVTGIEKTIDPLRRTLDSVTVGKFLASSPDIFGAGKLPFPEYLRHHAPAGVTSKRQLMELFEKYSKERFLDFVSNFSEVEHRNLGRIDLMRIRQRMQSDMKSEFEGQFRLVLAGQADRADEAVRASLTSYFERSGPLEQNWSIINNRKVIKAAA